MFLFVTQEKAHHPITRLCRLLGVSTNGYYAWRCRGPSARAQRDAELTARIEHMHHASRGIYGAPRVHAELTLGQGIACSRKRVARLMRAAGLAGIHRRRHHGMTRRDPRRPLVPDRVQRDFTPVAPDLLWVADLIQHRTAEGWLYAGVVLDAFSRQVIGWAMDERPVPELAVNGLTMAVRNRRPGPGPSTTPTTAPCTRPSPSAARSRLPGSRDRWGTWAMPLITRWRRASSPPCRPSSSTAAPGQRASSSDQRSSST